MRFTLSLILLSSFAEGLIFFDDTDTTAQTVAPAGAYLDSGWQFQGRYGSFHGTMISPKHFLTAAHFGSQGSTFTQAPLFSGEATTKTFTVRNRVRITGTDFIVAEIWETFDDYIPLYSGGNETGLETVITGAGRGRGTAISAPNNPNENRGWRWGSFDDRWGRNVIDGVASTSVGDLLLCDFDPVNGQNECQAADRDSGGAWFVKDPVDDTWKIAGINYAVDGSYLDSPPQPEDEDSVNGNGNEFSAALFDGSGFYVGRDPNWTLITFQPTAASSSTRLRSRTFANRVSSSATAIQNMIQPAIDDALSTPTQSFENWIAGYGSTTENSASDDADQDGLSNLEEYFSESDPTGANDATQPLTVAFLNNTTNRLTLTTSLDLAERNLSWVIQFSDTLDTLDWDDLSLSEQSNSRVAADGVRTITFDHSPPLTGPAFYRLKIVAAF